jgi:hypothetical protein
MDPAGNMDGRGRRRFMKTNADFPIGSRVKMTDLAIKQNLDGRKKIRTGTIVGARKKTLGERSIMVIRDGSKYKERWSVSFWELIS